MRARWWSRNTAFRTLRRASGFGPEVHSETIRHTVATRLLAMRVPAEEPETLLGHRVLKRTTAVYAKYDPNYPANIRVALTTLCEQVLLSKSTAGLLSIWRSRQETGLPS